MGTEFPDERPHGLAGRAEHVGSEGPGQLDRQVTHATGGGVDEHTVAGRDPRGVHQGLPRGEPGQRQGGATWSTVAGLRAK